MTSAAPQETIDYHRAALPYGCRHHSITPIITGVLPNCLINVSFIYTTYSAIFYFSRVSRCNLARRDVSVTQARVRVRERELNLAGRRTR